MSSSFANECGRRILSCRDRHNASCSAESSLSLSDDDDNEIATRLLFASLRRGGGVGCRTRGRLPLRVRVSIISIEASDFTPTDSPSPATKLPVSYSSIEACVPLCSIESCSSLPLPTSSKRAISSESHSAICFCSLTRAFTVRPAT